MAELKRTFVKGGMNLDLDERLVGQGLYREALNIRVSSSSEGNQGALETIRANVEIIALDRWGHQGDLPNNTFGPRLTGFASAKIVGTSVDKANDLAYHFVQDSVHVNNIFPEDGGPIVGGPDVGGPVVDPTDPVFVPGTPRSFTFSFTDGNYDTSCLAEDGQGVGGNQNDIAAGNVLPDVTIFAGRAAYIRFNDYVFPTFYSGESILSNVITIYYEPSPENGGFDNQFLPDAPANPQNGDLLSGVGYGPTYFMAHAESGEQKAQNLKEIIEIASGGLIQVEVEGSIITIYDAIPDLNELVFNGQFDENPGPLNNSTFYFSGLFQQITNIDQDGLGVNELLGMEDAPNGYCFNTLFRSFEDGVPGYYVNEDGEVVDPPVVEPPVVDPQVLPPDGISGRNVVIRSDAIYEYEPTQSMTNSGGVTDMGLMDLIFNDVYEIRSGVSEYGVDNEGRSYIQLDVDGFNMRNLDVREDMRVYQYDNIIGTEATVQPNAAPINDDIDAIYVDYVDRANYRIYLKDDQNVFINAIIPPFNNVVFKSKRILDFDYGNRYITGINVFDGLIFFTDSKNEPKKINILRSRVGTLSDAQSIYPDWITDRRFFHTRLLKENSDDNIGFQGVPEWDFTGHHPNGAIAANAINTGLGGVIESHCTVLRPNPEEHLKVLTDISGGAISSENSIVGKTRGVMTHPFPIHPNHPEGKVLQFPIAFLNEAGFMAPTEGPGQLQNTGYVGGVYNVEVDSFYNFEHILGGNWDAMANDQIADFRASLTLDVPDTLGWNAWAGGFGREYIGGYDSYILYQEEIGASAGFLGMSDNSTRYGEYDKFDIQTLMFPVHSDFPTNIVDADNNQAVPYPVFKKYLNSGFLNLIELYPFDLPDDPTGGHILYTGGPIAQVGGYSWDGAQYNNSVDDPGDLDLFFQYRGTGGIRGANAASDNTEVLQYFSPGGSYSGDANPEGDIFYQFNTMSGPLTPNSHPVDKAYHLGGLFSQVNLSGPLDNIAAINEYWGIGNPAGMESYLHNGRIEQNENGAFRPTGPGRFVVQPHGFQVGDIIVLEGQGNVRNSKAVGQYTDVDYSQGGPNAYSTDHSILDSGNPLVGGGGGQDLGVMYYEGTNLARYATRRHDGFADRVRARIEKIEHINMRPNGGGAVVNGVFDENGWKDNLGNYYNDLTQKFIFLNNKLVNGTFNDGTNPAGEVVVGVDGNNINLPPSFFSTTHHFSQYVVTIRIIENNAKKPLDPTLRCDLSRNFLKKTEAGTLQTIGQGDHTKNAALLPGDAQNRKSPYFTAPQGWGHEGLTPDGDYRYYGPPLPQVWSVGLESEVDNSDRLSDERALREAMLRFSYRYQYEDNEYSGLAPFTTVIWRTLNQKIDWPNFYISLINEIKSLRLIDWAPKNIPHDVKAVELLVKSEEATNIYAVKKYDFRDGEFNLPANGSYTGLHPFNANTLGLTIDPNQMLRPFDSVPRNAKAQEVTANRVVYGNYLKDYNLVENAITNEDLGQIIASSDVKVNLEVGLYTYVNQIQAEILGPDGSPVSVGISSDDGVIELFEDIYSGVNPNFGIPQESIKSFRSYQVGIVYRDELGRETPVLTNRQAVIKVGPEDANKTQRLTVSVKNPHPSWAKSYKFFVKDTSLDYHVLPLEQVLHFIEDSTVDETSIEEINASISEGANSVLIFSSDHRNKVQEGDVLVQKRAHRRSGPPDPALSNMTNFYEPDNLTLEYIVQRITNEPPPQLLVDTDGGDVSDEVAQFEGKFFVYVKTDRPLIVNNDIGPLPGPNTAKTQGVFETRPKPNYDTDLYYEASQAYPIVLDDDTDEQFVKVGRMVEAYYYSTLVPGPGGSLSLNSNVQAGDTFFPQLYTSDVDGDGAVSILDEVDLTPIVVTGVRTNVGRHSINDDIFTELTLDQAVTITVPPAPDHVVLKIQEYRGGRLNVGEHVYVTVAQSVVNSNTILVKRHTHLSNFRLVNDLVLPIALPYYNCFCFGNGIEISTANNSFNGARIQKGVKASSIYDDYAEVKVGEGLIFSGIYNSYSNFNETNQFIEALGITKRFNPDHGTVQKLFSRANDLIVLCEDKILKVLSNKDAIFKADSNPELLATNRVLGQSIAFDGEYGISNNPESFAHYGFRSYFTDAKRGVVIRLSKDGMTLISDEGMDSYFKEYLTEAREGEDYLFGSYDIDKGEYLISSQTFKALDIEDPINEGLVIAWDESLDTWTSFHTYYASAQGYSLKNQYFSHLNARTYHHDNEGAAYGYHVGYHQGNYTGQEPRVALIYNESPGIVKDFTYINYEGSQAKIIPNSNDRVLSTNLAHDGWWVSDARTDLEVGMSINFKNKENKWHNNFMHKSNAVALNAEEANKKLNVSLGNPISITPHPDGSQRLVITFDYGVIDLSSIQSLMELRITRFDPDSLDSDGGVKIFGLGESIGQNESLGLIQSFNSRQIVTDLTLGVGNFANVTTNTDYVTGSPIFNPNSLLEIVITSTSSPVEHSSVKGYYARVVWRNNDFNNKSELFSAALNAIESSK